MYFSLIRLSVVGVVGLEPTHFGLSSQGFGQV
jgi:hypothetical protein